MSKYGFAAFAKTNSGGGTYVSKLKSGTVPALATAGMVTGGCVGGMILSSMVVGAVIKDDDNKKYGGDKKKQAEAAAKTATMCNGGMVVAGLALAPLAAPLAIGLMVAGGIGLSRTLISAADKDGRLSSYESDYVKACYRRGTGEAQKYSDSIAQEITSERDEVRREMDAAAKDAERAMYQGDQAAGPQEREGRVYQLGAPAAQPANADQGARIFRSKAA